MCPEPTPGYQREPTLHGERVVFVSESDLWRAPLAGGLATRLTSNQVDPGSPLFSPDGAFVAYVAREEGHPEITVIPSAGGTPRRLTFQGSRCVVCAWSPDGKHVIYGSMAGQPHRRGFFLWKVPLAGGPPEPLPWGPADRVAYGPGGAMVLGRNVGDPARWKRYRGGTTGTLWIDREGAGDFEPLVELEGNLADPLWVGERVHFLSDHEGHGNLYSVTSQGEDLRRHTDHEDYYARNASADCDLSSGSGRIVYQHAAQLRICSPEGPLPEALPITLPSARPQRARRFVSARAYFEDADLHPAGHSLAIVARGKAFSMGNWEHAVRQHGEREGVRYRLARWLHKGKRLAVISDAGGEEALELHQAEPRPGRAPKVERLEGLEIGRPLGLLASPARAQVFVTNHRYELVAVDLKTKRARVLDRSLHGRMLGVDVSHDGRYVAYGFRDTPRTSQLRLIDLKEWKDPEQPGPVHVLTESVRVDSSPCFDPEGKYLAFVSYRTFNPVYDSHYFDLGFPRGGKPYLLCLQKDTPNPFHPGPSSIHGEAKPDPEQVKREKRKKAKLKAKAKRKAEKEAAKQKKAAKGESKGETPDSEAKQKEEEKAAEEKAKQDEKAKKPKPLKIDLEGIERRVLALPVEEGVFGHVEMAAGGKLFYDKWPIEGSLGNPERTEETPRGELYSYDLKTRKEEHFTGGISGFELGPDKKTLLYLSGKKLRLVKAEGKCESKSGETRESGWVDLTRPRIAVQPQAEWQQMYREAWRLQRDQFWSPDMAGLDWEEVYRRYLPVLARVATRSEFSDLMWEVQGELGTSHAYEYGGDYPRRPTSYPLGFLGADLRWRKGAWRIESIVRGDCWDPRRTSPLEAPGLDVREGDALVEIEGARLVAGEDPSKQLVHRAGREVSLTLRRKGKTRRVSVKTLTQETQARYRAWVEEQRRHVHEVSEGKLGYVHVPNMGPEGFAEFHRYYLKEVHHPGLIVDVRYNGGGHVSQLLLEKLARRRLGYDVPRHGAPVPYPEDAVLGPIVCLTNEHAGSDGDIFSHCFKLMGLGTLIGKRTWGGVVGIWPRHPLVDRTITTQAEFAFWFNDVGWGVENYGTDPDIEVEIRPQDWAAGRDPQLESAVLVGLEQIVAQNPRVPTFEERPNLRPPRLSSR